MKRVQDFLCFDFAPKFTQNFEARLAWGMPLSSAVCIELCPSPSVPPVLPRRSVGRSVGPPARPPARPSVRPSSIRLSICGLWEGGMIAIGQAFFIPLSMPTGNTEDLCRSEGT